MTPYQIDDEGRVHLGSRSLPVPTTVSPEAQVFLATPPWGDSPRPTDEVRPMWETRELVERQLKELSDGALVRFPVDVESMTLGGVRCQMVKPRDVPAENSGKVLVNLHGGGFVMGSGSLIEAIPIAFLAKVPVIAVDYRLAPEHPYPAAVDDALAVYRTLLESHTPSQIGVYGSSAGGFLTGQFVVRLQREALPSPACCGMFTAGGDLSDLGDTARIFTLMGFWGDMVLPVDHELSEIRAYLGGADSRDPGVSPANGDLRGFPPALLMSGTRDAVLSATASFHRALRRAGAEAELYVFEAMPHGHWYLLHLPETQEALEIMAAFFLKHLGSKQG